MKRSLLLVTVALVAGCRKPEATAQEKARAQAPAAVKVETAPVETRKMPRYLTLTGSVLANRQSEVAANVNGRVISTSVERGQAVKTGQPLAVVDARAAGLSAAAAAAQSRAAETQVSLAQTECDRADKLFAQNVMSKADYDRVKTQCTAQLYSASAARANADLTSKLAGDAVIRAPFDGIVGERYVNVGEYVQLPTRVASMFSIDPVRVQISVPETAVSLVKEGQTLDVRVAAWPDRAFPAKVRYVSPALRPSTRDLLVEALAANTDGALRPGMFATVLLLVGEEEMPTVPTEALRTEGSVKRLFVARAGQAVEMVVRTGVAKDGRVAVLETFANNEQVVLRPPPGLRDGAAIQ